MLNIIRNWVIKTMMKSKGETGIVKTIPKRDLVELNTQITAQRLMENGIDPNSLKNTNQVENAIIAIENKQKANLAENIRGGIGNTKTAKVFNIEGQQLDPNKPIMGGTQTGKELSPELSDRLRGTNVDRMKQKIADKKVETEAETLARIEEENKKGIEGLKQKMKKEQARSKRISGNLRNDNQLRGQTEEIGKPKIDEDEYEYYREILDDEENMIVQGDETREQLDAMVKEAEDEVAYMKRLYDKGALDPPEDMAQGGRAGYKFGLGPLFNFLNKKSPMKAYTDYLESVKKRMKAGKEAEVAGEVIPIAAGGALITNQLKKKLKAMNEEQKKEFKKDMEKKADGGRIGYKDGPDIKLYPRARGREVEQEVGPGIKISERDIDYGITGLLEGDKFFGGAEIDKGKVKIDVLSPEGDTLFKDTIGKKDAVNFILGMGDPKGEKFQIKTDKDFENMNIILRKSFADGGRIGLKAGMTKRAFLKLMGGTGAAIGALKSGIFSGFGKGAGKQVAKEVVEQGVRSAPPPYFFELANKIKMLGKPDKVTYADRVEIHRYRGKNGDEYELIEDLNTGDVRITKDKTGIGSSGDKTFDTIEDRTVLEYKKGDADVDPESGTAFKEADEYEEYKVEFDADGTPADATELDAVVQKEIIEEATGDAPSIKKAGGGIARMLGE